MTNSADLLPNKLSVKLNISILLPVKMSKIAGWVANSEETDRTDRLFTLVCLSEHLGYCNLIKLTPK